MKNSIWQQVRLHVIAIGIFLAVSVIYCLPAFRGMVVNQHDTLGWKGMAQQSFEYKEKYGHFPLWTNSLFSGMPAYQIAMEADNHISFNYFSYILQLGLPQPANFFFLACICFYILCLVMRLNPWAGILSAIAYSFSTYDPVIISVGHVTKMLAIGYAPLVLAGLMLLYEKKYWLGASVFAIGLSQQLGTSHLQIVYYTLLIAVAMSILYLVNFIRKKDYGGLIRSGLIALLVTIACVGVNALPILLTGEFVKETMRGGTSEIKDKKDKNTTEGGLDKDYAFNWSYGIAETFTLLQPSFYGGGNGGHHYKQSKFADKLSEVGYPEEDALRFANGSSYWGDQPGTSGPVYLGAIICLLCIVGLFTLKSPHKGWLIAIGIFGIVLSWGKNLESVNYFLFDYLPLYKKFRAPTSALVIPQLVFCLMAGLTLNQLLFADQKKDELLKKLLRAGYVMGALLAILLIFYFSSDFSGKGDNGLRDNFSNAMLQQLARGGNPTPEMQQQASEFGRSFVRALQEDRKSLYFGDWIRNTLFISLAFAGLLLFLRGKFNRNYVLAGLLVLSGIDLLLIGRRYLSDADFVDKSTYEEAFNMTPADQQIKQDTSYFRVFNQTQDPFNEAYTSYYHNSVGGYSPAKLNIYQDLIENQLAKGNMGVYNMLNTKYFIVNNPQTRQPVAQFNPGAFGPVWLVKAIQFVPNAKAEMTALDSMNLRDTAVVRENLKSYFTSQPQADSTASIRMIYNHNDTILYQSKSATPQFSVFSEIYYPHGWNVYLDGKKSGYIRVDYALRGMSLPAGEHRIEFRFEPEKFSLGNRLGIYSSLALFALLLGSIYFTWKKYRISGQEPKK